ncbi:MAG: redoxin domain-containing protein [Acidobacteria bacterium]|nr:redoxin domain-containing protein [Acidobacteriota bacterium]
MHAWKRIACLTTALGLFTVWGACTAGDLPATKIKIGEKMADFTLPDASGKQHSLYELEGKKAVAVVFIATQCPYSNAFNPVMAKLAREYAGRGVAFVGINANKTEPAAEVAEHAKTHGLGFTVLKDEGNVIADRLGASVTPEIFLLDSDWTLRYHGALGNSAHPTTKAEEATDAEFRPALESVLSGGTVARAETKAFGCTIKRI